MKKYLHAIITKLSFRFLFGLLQLNFLYISIQCAEYNRSNIISFEKNYRYLSFASYSNGDMIFSSTAFPKTNKRIFYGLKNNGRPFFKNGSNYSVDFTDDWEDKNESIIFSIKASGENEKEYLISIANNNSFFEIYDFYDLKKIILNQTK